jgi:exonuclease V
MLYHKLLTDFASNLVPADIIFERYKLDAHQIFTKSFIENIAELEDNFIHDGTYSDDHAIFNTPEHQRSELSQYNSLTKLWSLMIDEFQRTMPTPSAMSDILQVEYRRGTNGEVMGNQCFVYDSVALDRYLAKTMDWWKGRREAKGVDIEEAFKCKACEFVEICDWRKSKVEEGIKNFREKKRVGKKKWKV